jgi:hypothetical protein
MLRYFFILLVTSVSCIRIRFIITITEGSAAQERKSRKQPTEGVDKGVATATGGAAMTVDPFEHPQE